MSDLPSPIRVAQATSILLATTLAGANAGLSFFVIPRLLESPTPLMLRQWGNMFGATKRYLPVPFLVPGVLNIYLAIKLPEKVRLYALAAALSLSVSPYAITFMLPINKKLSRKIEDVKSVDLKVDDTQAEEFGPEETAHSLVDQWGIRNIYSSGVSFIAGALGLYAVLA